MDTELLVEPDVLNCYLRYDKVKHSDWLNIVTGLQALNESAENTHLLCKGNYQCMANLLFDWLGFSRFAYVE